MKLKLFFYFIQRQHPTQQGQTDSQTDRQREREIHVHCSDLRTGCVLVVLNMPGHHFHILAIKNVCQSKIKPM